MAIRIAWGIVLALAALSACGDGGGGSSSGSGGGSTPLNWVSTSTGGGGGGTATPLNWVNPNSGLGATTNGGGPILSNDPRNYHSPTNFILPWGTNTHSLMTETSNPTIVNPENSLAGLLNNYRNQVLGGNPVVNPINPFPTQGGSSMIPMHEKVRQMARAHCKHYAYFHPGIALPRLNEEGDTANTTAPGSPADTLGHPPIATARRGRLGKCGVTVRSAAEFVLSGVDYKDADAAFDWFVDNDPWTILGAWTHFAVGHWRGGTEAFYWNVVWMVDPDPAT